jgi:hypothetical protein
VLAALGTLSTLEDLGGAHYGASVDTLTAELLGTDFRKRGRDLTEEQVELSVLIP